MVMMMVLPLLLVTVLPKMMQDPDTKKEMEEIQAKMNVQNNINMPEVISKVSCLDTSFMTSFSLFQGFRAVDKFPWRGDAGRKAKET